MSPDSPTAIPNVVRELFADGWTRRTTEWGVVWEKKLPESPPGTEAAVIADDLFLIHVAVTMRACKVVKASGVFF